jgi:predicted RNA-binding protein YlqC (UPF0109 family)
MTSLGFFGAGAWSDSDKSDAEEAEEVEVAAATAPVVDAQVVEAHVSAGEPTEPAEDVLRRAELKRKRGQLLSPAEAASLVGNEGPTYQLNLAGGDADEQTGQATKRAAFIGTDGSKTAHVSDAVAAHLLAGGAKQLKALEQATGCRVMIDKSEKERHADDNTARRVTIVGDNSALTLAERRLHEIILASGSFIQRVLRITQAQAGYVIGRGGNTIKRLQIATGTLITVSGKADNAAGSSGGGADAPRTVSIRGWPAAVDAASRLIYAYLREPEALESLLQEAGHAGTTATSKSGQAYGDGASYLAV